MVGTYVYTPEIWPPLATALAVVLLGLYGWRRRELPGARWFAAACLFWSLLLAGSAGEAAAADPATKFAWHTFQALWQLPVATAVACFTLEFVQPGRWLTRRNLILLAIPPLLVALLILTNPAHHLFWRGFSVADVVRAEPAASGWIAVGYAMLLALIQAAALIWLFIHSAQHRWPVLLMLSALILTRSLFLVALVGFNPTAPLESTFALTFLSVATYAVALFGFHIFDPLPVARQAVLEQMSAGVVVFDTRWRMVSLNPAAEKMLGLRNVVARGKPWSEIAPTNSLIPDASTPYTGMAAWTTEATLGDDARQYTAMLSPLRDFRGLPMGHLLMVSDVSAQRQAQAQIVGQQRALAALHEREQLARELHDSIGQVLGYASLQVDAAGQLIGDRQTAKAAAQLTRLAAVLQDAHADVREQILNLRAAPSPQQPLFATVRHYLDGFTNNYAIGTKLAIGEGLSDEMLAPETQLQLFRILQEALSNARKHSRARGVEVTFAAKNDALRMCIADDGCGFDPAATTDGGAHLGLHFMRERAEELGGSLQVASSPGAGTRVAVAIPRQEF